jgi:hypothetical protein
MLLLVGLFGGSFICRERVLTSCSKNKSEAFRVHEETERRCRPKTDQLAAKDGWDRRRAHHATAWRNVLSVHFVRVGAIGSCLYEDIALLSSPDFPSSLAIPTGFDVCRGSRCGATVNVSSQRGKDPDPGASSRGQAVGCSHVSSVDNPKSGFGHHILLPI